MVDATDVVVSTVVGRAVVVGAGDVALKDNSKCQARGSSGNEIIRG